MRIRLPFSAVVLLVLSACSGGDSGSLTDDGYRALSSGDPEEALAKFESALGSMPPTDPRYVETKLGAIRARAHGDAEADTEKPQAKAAVAELLALAKSNTVRAEDYRLVVTDLATASAYESAVEVLKAGRTAFPEDPKWEALINKVGDAAKAAGNTKAVSALEGLGYLGGD